MDIRPMRFTDKVQFTVVSIPVLTFYTIGLGSDLPEDQKCAGVDIWIFLYVYYNSCEY